MVNLPTFRQLEHLVLLADHGHFGRAATACHVTQSTLSASIKELENILQASLVDRTRRRVVLTPLGHEIVERARRILGEGEDLVETARSLSEPLSGTPRMGVVPTVGPFLLPNILPGLRCGYPALRLYLVEDLTARLVEELRPGELLLLKEGHCLREQALSACRLADRKQIEAVEATSLHTLMEMQRVEFAMYAPAIGQASLTEGTVTAGREVLLGRRRGPLALLRSPVSDPT